MELNEVLELKRTTEKCIRNMLLDFNDKTGLLPTGVRVETVDASAAGGIPKFIVGYVKLEINL